MKAVFQRHYKYIFHLKDGSTVKSKYQFGRSMYQYREVPKDEVVIYKTWEEALEHTLYCYDTTLFSKRKYINHSNLTNKVYEDEFDYLEIQYTYKIIDNPDIETLQKDLGFKGYSELVFDRECELRKLMEVN